MRDKHEEATEAKRKKEEEEDAKLTLEERMAKKLMPKKKAVGFEPRPDMFNWLMKFDEKQKDKDGAAR